MELNWFWRRLNIDPNSTFAITVSRSLTLLLGIFLTVQIFPLFAQKYSVTLSTHHRVKYTLAEEDLYPVWCSDTTKWLDSLGTVEDALKYFYYKTGIQPYLYLTENINGDPLPSILEVAAFTRNLHQELFGESKGHLVIVFQDGPEDDSYITWGYTDQESVKVFDNEAYTILVDYLDLTYKQGHLDSRYFADAFRNTANRIMEVTKDPTFSLILFVIGGLTFVLCCIFWGKIVKFGRRLISKGQDYSRDSNIGDFYSEDSYSEDSNSE